MGVYMCSILFINALKCYILQQTHVLRIHVLNYCADAGNYAKSNNLGN